MLRFASESLVEKTKYSVMGFRDYLEFSRNGRDIDVLLDYVLMFSPQFIQPSGSPATEVMEFTLPQCFMPWTPAVAHYLRQNLLIFLHIPKYTDSYVEHHFKVCNTTCTLHWYHYTESTDGYSTPQYTTSR